MKAAQAQAAIRRALGRAEELIMWSEHFQKDTTKERDHSAADVLFVLENLTELVQDDESGRKWKIYGPLVSGEDYAVVVRFRRGEDTMIIVTAHVPP